MKCRNSAFNAQGSNVIIVAAQVGVVKTCEAAVEALRQNESQRETPFITKIDGFPRFPPPSPLSKIQSYKNHLFRDMGCVKQWGIIIILRSIISA
jgi:hypothetical protein